MVSIVTLKTEDELFQEYPGRGSPQRCYLQLDPSKRLVSCHSDPSKVGAPTAVWHMTLLRFALSGVPTGTAANALMRSAVTRHLASEICDGYKLSWDGHDYVGHYSSQAERAQDDLLDWVSTQSEQASQLTAHVAAAEGSMITAQHLRQQACSQREMAQ